jgi:hypothetical protein
VHFTFSSKIMIFSLFLVATVLAVPQQYEPSVGVFRRPQSTDLRSPCPGLNILANHGYLPRNGRGYTREMVTSVFKDVYNIGEDISKFLLDESFTMGLNDTEFTLSLQSIGRHSKPQNLIEHDGSMAHTDFALAGNVNTVEPRLVEKMISFSKSNRASLNFTELIEYRKWRWLDAIASNPEIDAGGRPQFLAAAEVTLLFQNFKNEQGVLPVSSVRSIFYRNQLPRGFVKQNETLNRPKLFLLANEVRVAAAPPTPLN